MDSKDSTNMETYSDLSVIQSIELYILDFGLDYSISMEKKNRLVEYIAIPFVASLGASLSTAIPDKLRSFCL